MSEPSHEDEYFADCEFDIEGTLLTPENSVAHLYQPHCWDTVEVELDSGESVDIILDADAIRIMVKSGFLCRVHGHPSDGYKEWYVLGVMKAFDTDANAFYDELGQ